MEEKYLVRILDDQISSLQNIERAIESFIDAFGSPALVCYVPASVYSELQDENYLQGTTKVEVFSEGYIFVKG